MYKKYIVLVGLLASFTQHASYVSTLQETPWLEIKPSYFFLNASPMKCIYTCGHFQLQGSASIPVFSHVDVYSSIGYRCLKGQSLNAGEKTKLTVLSIDAGVKALFNFAERFYYFFTVGPRYFRFNQCNGSSYVDGLLSDSGMGLFVNTGFKVLLADHVLLGIFGEYSSERGTAIPEKTNILTGGDTQMGGFAFGVSLGCAF